MKKPENWGRAIYTIPVSTVATEPAEEELESIEQDSIYTHRVRKQVNKVPIENKPAQQRFQRIARKAISILRFTQVSKEIKTFGVHSVVATRKATFITSLKRLKTGFYNMTTTIDENPTERCLISPTATWKQVWDMYISVLLIFCLLYIPFRLSFMSDNPEESGETGFDYGIDICFLIDIIFTLNTKVLVDRDYVTDRKVIFCMYLRGFLIIDVASIFPFDLVQSSSSSGSNKLLRLLRLGRLIRILGSKTLKNWMKSVLKSQSGNGPQGPVVLLACIVIVLLAGHIIACFWHLMAVLENGPDNWVVVYGMSNVNTTSLYIRCLYWTIVILATVGYGDITPANNYERELCIFWLVAGTLLFSTIVGTVVSTLTSSDSRTQIISAKINEIEDLANDLQVNPAMKKRLIDFVKTDTTAQVLTSDQRAQVMSMLSPQFRELIYEKSYNGSFKTLKFVSALPREFVNRFFSMVSYTKQPKGFVLYRTGDFADNVYFLIDGRLSYVLSGFCFRQIVAGYFIGEIEVLDRSLRAFTCMTDTDCELLVVKSKQFLDFLHDFPVYKKRVEELAVKRKENNQKTADEMLELFSILRNKKFKLEDVQGKQRSLVGFAAVDNSEKRESRSVRDELELLYQDVQEIKSNLKKVTKDFEMIAATVRSMSPNQNGDLFIENI